MAAAAAAKAALVAVLVHRAGSVPAGGEPGRGAAHRGPAPGRRATSCCAGSARARSPSTSRAPRTARTGTRPCCPSPTDPRRHRAHDGRGHHRAATQEGVRGQPEPGGQLRRPHVPPALASVDRRRLPAGRSGSSRTSTTRPTTPATTPIIYASFPTDNMVSHVDAVHARAPTTTKTWYKAPLRPGASDASGRPPSREGDRFLLTFDSFVDAEPDHANGAAGRADRGARLPRRRTRRPRAGTRWATSTWEPPTPATYRVELDVTAGQARVRRSRRRRTRRGRSGPRARPPRVRCRCRC